MKRRKVRFGLALVLVGAGAAVLWPTLATGRRQATPFCLGKPATIVGTAGNDTLPGTSGDDVIVALAGNGTVDGGPGNDTICGGPGNDGHRRPRRRDGNG